MHEGLGVSSTSNCRPKFCFSGKWFLLKKLVFKILLGLRKRRQKAAAATESGGRGYGIKSHSTIEEMECVQPLCDDEMVRTS